MSESSDGASRRGGSGALGGRIETGIVAGEAYCRRSSSFRVFPVVFVGAVSYRVCAKGSIARPSLVLKLGKFWRGFNVTLQG
jgi:hypothetical protein